jgi:hypothetical protein
MAPTIEVLDITGAEMFKLHAKGVVMYNKSTDNDLRAYVEPQGQDQDGDVDSFNAKLEEARHSGNKPVSINIKGDLDGFAFNGDEMQPEDLEKMPIVPGSTIYVGLRS